MAKKRPKFDQKYIEKLKKKGLIGEDTYRICMADGGVVPAKLPDQAEDAPFLGRTLSGIIDKVSDAYSGLRDQTQAVRSGEIPPQVIPAASDLGPQVAPVESPNVDPSELAVSKPQAPPVQMPNVESQMGGLTKAFDNYESGINQQSEAARRAAADEAGAIQGYMDKAQEMEARSQMREQERMDKLEQAEAEYQEISNELTVDPQRFEKEFWSNASSGQKLLAGIGMIFGGAANLDRIDRLIDRDIQVQKANINNRLDSRKTLLDTMRQRFGDERTAELATKRFLLDQAEMKIKQIGSIYKGQEIQGRMQQALGELQLKKAEVQSEMQQKLYQQAVLRQFSGGGQTDLANFLPEEQRKRYVPVAGALAPTEKAAGELNDLAKTTEVVRDSVDALKALGDKPYSDLSLEDRAEADTIQNSLIGQLRIALTGPGPLTDSEREFIKSIIANPTNIFEVTARKRLDSLMTALDRNFNASLRAYGIKGKPKLKFGERVR